jgi:phenylacetic acid degradation operon negative regulatory protein
MKAKTELLLHRLLWLADKPMRPTFRNIEDSFEGWAYYRGLLPQIRRLEAQGLLEGMTDERSGQRLHRLTEAGRLAAAGGRDPEAAWSAVWDQQWRLFLFDIPEVESSKRRLLNRALARAGCGCLQGSVWISPHLPSSLEAILAEEDPDCGHLLLLLAASKGKIVDGRMVLTAWNFAAIGAGYEAVVGVLDQFPQVAAAADLEVLADWTARELGAWRKALAADPLLPAALHPKDYQGPKVSQKRRKILEQAGRLARTLAPGALARQS